jgi:hypothetical protein
MKWTYHPLFSITIISFPTIWIYGNWFSSHLKKLYVSQECLFDIDKLQAIVIYEHWNVFLHETNERSKKNK